MSMRRIGSAKWPFLQQITEGDFNSEAGPAVSERSKGLQARTKTATEVVKSICPYCAVGCGQDVYVRDGRVVQIEGDPDSPISRGGLCPQGGATLHLTPGEHGMHQVLYRRPHGTDWEELDLDTAMSMVADRIVRTRAETWEWE